MRNAKRAGLWLGLTAGVLLGACSTEETETGGGAGPTTTTTTANGGSGGTVQGGSGGSVQGGSGGSDEGGSGGSDEGGSGGGAQGGSGGSDEGGSGGAGGDTGGHPPEDLCSSTPVAEGVHEGVFEELTDTVNPGDLDTCTGWDEPGPDAIYAISVPAAETLLAVLWPEDDGGLYILTDCDDPTNTCVAGWDEGGNGETETLQWENSSNAEQLVYVVVDSYYADATGHYELLLNLGDEHTCDDFLDNDMDDAVDCADTTTCQSTNACTAGAGVTGVACTANTDCAAVGGDPACITWDGWFGGYCSDWCDTTNDNCAGDGLCADVGGVGLCFDGCTTTADCRQDYVCDTLTEGDACVPDLEACVDAATAALGDNAGDTTGGPDGPNSSCDDWGAEAGFVYTATGNGTLDITLASATDQGFAVYSPDCAASNEMTCIDAEYGGTDEVGTITVTTGTEYFIVVKAWDPGDEGPFTLTLAFTAS